MQQTLKTEIEYSGKEVFGGREIDVILSPAPEFNGIIFRTENGPVPAKLKYARQYKSSVLLQRDSAKVLHVEHLLAALFAYGIDNCDINIRRRKPLMTTGIVVVPLLHGREKELCDMLEDNIRAQDAPRTVLYTEDVLGDDKLMILPNKNSLVVEATTEYSPVGLQSYSIAIGGSAFKDNLSRSRSYVKHIPRWFPMEIAGMIASVANPEFGYGHGFIPDEFFFPQKTPEHWRMNERYPAEIARHTIVDRLGAISLLDGRLVNATVIANRSGHQHDIDVLKDAEKKLQRYDD